MTKKLIHVVRGRVDRGHEVFLDAPVRAHPQALNPRQVDMDSGDFVRECEFFLVNEDDVPASMTAFAQKNPGCEVRVYGLEGSAQAQAGPIVFKKVTKDGELPA